MIPFNFEYYKPSSIHEAVQLFQRLDTEEKQPIYYSGGTEIISLARINILYTKAIIDIKSIPECNVLHLEKDQLVLGACLPLTEIEESNFYPLLTKTIQEIADRTARNKITIGGNICGQIFYREAILPFLISNSQVVIAGIHGIKTMPIQQVFHQHLHLKKGEFLVQMITEKADLHLPFISIKKRQQWDTGYPLITVTAAKKPSSSFIENSSNQSLTNYERIQIAFSGLNPFPYRSEEIERDLNQQHLSLEQKVDLATSHLPEPILDDFEGSAQYRKFVMKNTLQHVLSTLEVQ
ncbi:FAD binding domain-containing protein [Chengkuizengella axinellae]|uniref:FAD binding domain-containing protein n=1 Tax=Chengkuizengella axinellae TaxID=3064388 RepID=A0ABT9J3Q6_9BACL|nr:FAD binding domain-containing protein [Chengkuizengella sp. 2205SS18-9]MDP5276247.1 FAD binding domain-containing protein [Chengkuizengella sp. 2205SS18-9]